MTTFTLHALAAGHDNIAGLTLIGAIVPSSDIHFPEPSGAQHGYKPGLLRIRLDGKAHEVGFNSETWLMSHLTFPQYKYLKTTYCAGGYRGFVTVKTRWQQNSYDEYNATIIIPQEDTLSKTYQGYENVPITFQDLVAA